MSVVWVPRVEVLPGGAIAIVVILFATFGGETGQQIA
jgi:hypothetical protein